MANVSLMKNTDRYEYEYNFTNLSKKEIQVRHYDRHDNQPLTTWFGNCPFSVLLRTSDSLQQEKTFNFVNFIVLFE